MKRNLYGIKDVVTQDIHSISMFSSDLEMLRNYRAILEKNKNDISLGADVVPIFDQDLDIYFLGTIDNNLTILPSFEFVCKLSECSSVYDNLRLRSSNE